MSRRFGIDVSHFQNPTAPAGVAWQEIAKQSTFVIVRFSYGAWPDPNAVQHVAHGRSEAMQVGGYHFLVIDQPVPHQLDVFCDQAIKCGVGAGDIVPALDIEDDGPRLITRAAEPIVRQACDRLIAEFGACATYITQRDWIRLGSPAWLLALAQWTANYTNAPKPLTPGNVVPAIWQNRVGLYAPGAPFVAKDAYLPNAIDQDVADGLLPLATRAPRAPGQLPAVGPAPPPHTEVWQRRLDALTQSAYDEQNTGHSSNEVSYFDDDEAPTKPDGKL